MCFALNLDVERGLSTASHIVLYGCHVGVLLSSALLIFFYFRKIRTINIKLKYYRFFLISYTASLYFLHTIWSPYLLYGSKGWGFDPQRYYYYASEMIRYGGTLDYDLNGWGVVYFYKYPMQLIGTDPMIPLFLNSILTLYAILVVSHFFFKNNTKHLYYFSLILLLPEVIYFNFMSSREIPCMVFMTICLCKAISGYQYKSKIDIVISFIAFVFLYIIRPTMALPIIMGIIIYLGFNAKNKFPAIIGIVAILALTYVVNAASENLDITESTTDVVSSTQDRFDVENQEEREYFNYSSNSIARLLTPHNYFEFIVFGLIRPFVYICITPSFIRSPFKTLSLEGDVGQCDGFSAWTTLFMFLLIPLIYKTLKRYKSYGKNMKIVICVFASFFIVVGMFNTSFIHPRYRLVYDLLYFSLAYYGFVNRKLLNDNKKTPADIG